jgi:two-component system, NarL family, sensor histidine kinase DesK
VSLYQAPGRGTLHDRPHLVDDQASVSESRESEIDMTAVFTDLAPASTNHRSPPPNLAPNLARTIVVVVFGSYALIAFLRIFYQGYGPPSRVVLSTAYLIPMLWLQLYVFGRRQAQFRPPILHTALLCQALLVYGAIAYSPAWLSLTGFLAGSVLLVLRPRFAWPAFALVVASMAVNYSRLTDSPLEITYAALSTTISGLVVYGLTRLQSLVMELDEARTELAQMAVNQERMRFARDLHDLLGYSLSAITLKSELTHRLVPKNPDRAQSELVEILDISRKALADVRSVASGYRELSLENESESARSLLLAADVAVTTEIKCGDLPTPVKTVLATVLREGITNVLRHSTAERCAISMRQEDGLVWLDIVNDGVPTNHARSHGGSGIKNLSARLAALHGQLVAGIEADGRYGLHAWAPIGPSMLGHADALGRYRVR